MGTIKVINKTGKTLFFKIGPREQPLLCQSTGQTMKNPASKDSGTYTFAVDTGVTGSSISPLCDMAVFASSASQTDFSPVYALYVGQIALISWTGNGGDQRLVASDKPFGWNPFEGDQHGQTMFEFTFGANKIFFDVSLVPAGCDDIPHPGSGWQRQLGWGKQADFKSVLANSISPSCPRCKDNKWGPAFNFGGIMTCDSGGVEYSCLGPVEGTWSTGNGKGWPKFCGNPDTSCAADSKFAQPTERKNRPQIVIRIRPLLFLFVIPQSLRVKRNHGIYIQQKEFIRD